MINSYEEHIRGQESNSRPFYPMENSKKKIFYKEYNHTFICICLYFCMLIKKRQKINTRILPVGMSVVGVQVFLFFVLSIFPNYATMNIIHFLARKMSLRII